MAGNADDGYRKAIALHRAGRFAEAEQVYRTLPEDANVLQLLGVLCYQSGRRREGTELLHRALEKDPDHAEALSNLGVILHEQKDFPAALAILDRAVKVAPGNPELLNKRGFILQDLERHEEAVVNFQLALDVAPQMADAWFNLGNSFQNLGRYDEAEAALRKAMALRPMDPDTLTNLGGVLLVNRKENDAVQLLARSIEIRPTADAYHNLASALSRLGRRDEAISAANTSIQLEPKNPRHHGLLALLFQGYKRNDLAIPAYRKALELDPADSFITAGLGLALNQEGRFDESLQVFASAPSLSDGTKIAAALTVPAIPMSSDEIEVRRQRVLNEIARLSKETLTVKDPLIEVNGTSFFWAYHHESELHMQQAAVDLYLKACPDLGYVAPHIDKPKKSGKIRLGVCSAHLNKHTIGKLFIRLISGLRDDDIEVFTLDAATFPDEWTKDLNSKVDRAYKLSIQYHPSRELISSLELDALFYPDIGMAPITYYLAYARLAPLQFMTWGHPASTALPNMDCFLSSVDLEREGSEVDYSERLVKFDELMTVFSRPQRPEITRADLGLPEDKRLYVCPQTSFKLHPDFDRVFSEILRRDDKALIVLITGNEKHWDDLLRQRFQMVMPDVASRIVFLKKLDLAHYLGLNMVADALLDTFYFGGGNSSLEAFSVGAPIVTLPGKMLRGRITLAQYRKMGIDDLIARDADHYIELALRLAHDKDWHREMSALIEERCHVLYDNHKPIDELRAFLHREIGR